MSIAQNFPTISPSLLLDFANVQALDSRITFTRATTATYYGTRTALAEQNLVLESQTFSNTTAWFYVNTTVLADVTTAPDATATADKVSNIAATGLHFIRPQDNATYRQNAIAGTTYVASIYVKADSAPYAFLSVYSGTSLYAGMSVDLSTNAVLSAALGTGWSIVSATSTQVASSAWYRLVLTFVSGSTGSVFLSIGIGESSGAISSNGQAASYLGTDGVGYFIWGAQVEQRSSVTAYQVTTTQPVTNYIPVLETAASGVARFDHNPVTFESLGLLIEEQRTNLFTYSEQFDNAAWTKLNATVTANTIVAPDGTISGDTLTTSGAAVAQRVAQSPTATGSLSFSVYAKAGSAQFIQILQTTDGNVFGNFDLANGVVGTKGSSATSTITAVGNGWYRCSVSATLASSNNWGIYIIPSATSAYGALYTATVANLFIWGAQLEAASFATSYIPTVASQVTRAADSANISGTNFTSFYNQAAGSLYLECNYLGSSGLAAEFVQSTSVSNRWYTLGNNGSNRAQFVMRPLGSVQADINDSGVSNPPNTMTKITVAYAVNDFAISQNGRSPITDTSGYVTNDLNQLIIGNTSAGNASLNGRIKKLAFYPLRLTNAQLQALTG